MRAVSLSVGTLAVLLLFTAMARAEMINLPSIPTSDPKYTEAVNKAVKAAYIQTGIQGKVDGVAEVATQRATKVATDAINFTSIKPEAVFFLAGASYSMLVKRQVTKSFRNPIFHNVTNTVTLSDKNGASGSITVKIPF